jgi:ArsR family transcriptional regulator
MKELIRVMKALSDPNRVKVIKMLQEKELCVCEIQSALRLAQPTVSRHMKVLEDAGLVASRKDGLWVNYSLNSDGHPYATTLLRHLQDWLRDDPDIRRMMKKLPLICREDICRR